MTEQAGRPEATWVAATRIRFADGGEPEYQVLHEGTEKDCEQVLALTHAVAYSGDRPIADAEAFMVEVPAGAGAEVG
jgi:hypothetical protein